MTLAKPGLLFALSGALFAGCGGVQVPTAAAVGAPVAYKPDGKKTKTFYYTGAQQNFTVPYGVKHVTITAIGAPTKSGHGGLVAATIAVTPGESLAVFVGGGPSHTTGGFNGGGDGGVGGVGDGSGGGGASDVRQSGSELKNRVIVAGGAGGAGAFHGGHAGRGGGLEGAQGRNGRSGDNASGSYYGGGGGGGGSQTAGGAAGYGGGAGESGGLASPAPAVCSKAAAQAAATAARATAAVAGAAVIMAAEAGAAAAALVVPTAKVTPAVAEAAGAPDTPRAAQKALLISREGAGMVPVRSSSPGRSRLIARSAGCTRLRRCWSLGRC
jgi:hypothetical protein